MSTTLTHELALSPREFMLLRILYRVHVANFQSIYTAYTVFGMGCPRPNIKTANALIARGLVVKTVVRTPNARVFPVYMLTVEGEETACRLSRLPYTPVSTRIWPETQGALLPEPEPL